MPRITSKTKYDQREDHARIAYSSDTNYDVELEPEPKPIREVKKQLGDLNSIIYYVVVTILIMLAGIVIDTIYFHIEENRWHSEYNLLLEQKLNK